MTRKLVTVRRVSALNPIPGADRIQTAAIDGWTCIVAVGEFQEGDRGLYFEIDSFLPVSDPRWAFLGSRPIKLDSGAEGFRIRTVKMRGVVSQGLLMPLAKFPEVVAEIARLEGELGADEAAAQIRTASFQEMLGVCKWEPLTAGHEQARMLESMADFPDFIPRTDQERVQNMPDVFDRRAAAEFQETTKMDGSSMTVYFVRRDSQYFPFLPTFPPGCAPDAAGADLPEGRVGICSRNRDLAPDAARLFWAVALRHGLPAKLAAAAADILGPGGGGSVALQGELCGATVQKNFEGFRAGEHDFFLFGVWDVDAQRHRPPREVHERWAPRLGIRHVPVIGYRPLREIATDVEALLRRAEGKGIHGRRREGIVLKEVDGAFSFKAISNSYLLKHGE